MAERVKVVNGNLIKAMTKEEVNKELVKKNDWPIHYFVPGRKLYPYFITVNKERYRFNSLEAAEKAAKMFNKNTLESMTHKEIKESFWMLQM